MKIDTFRFLLRRAHSYAKAFSAWLIQKCRPWFDKEKNLYFLLFLVFSIFFLNWRWTEIAFLLRANWITVVLISPFFFLFLWLYKRDSHSFGKKESFWTVISILTVILFFLFQNADQAATKGFTIYAANKYNCGVAEGILKLGGNRENKSENFPLHSFVTESYFQNADLLFGNYSEEVGLSSLEIAYQMQAANTLIAAVHGLNVQGVNPMNASSGYFIDMYNKQMIPIAEQIKKVLLCSSVSQNEGKTFFSRLIQWLKNK